MPDSNHLQGLRRWNDYLNARLQPWGIVRETGEEPETRDAVWRVGFPDDTRARIRVSVDALHLGPDGFEELVDQLNDTDFLGLLRAASPGGIRIYAGGKLEELWPEGIESEGIERVSFRICSGASDLLLASLIESPRFLQGAWKPTASWFLSVPGVSVSRSAMTPGQNLTG